MRIFLFVLLILTTTTANAQPSPPRPTSEQINIQILENEAKQYRQTIGQLVVQINELSAEISTLKSKCGKTCDPEKK